MKKLLVLTLAIGMLAGCKKKDKNNCTTDQNSLAGNYRTTAVKYKASANAAEQDYYNIVFPDVCDRDDITTLNANGTYAVVDAGTRCSPPNDYTGSWSMSGTNITIDGDAGIIQSWDCSTLVIYQNNLVTTGDKLTITMVRQ